MLLIHGLRSTAEANRRSRPLVASAPMSEIGEWLPDAELATVRLQSWRAQRRSGRAVGRSHEQISSVRLVVDGAREDPDELFERAHAAEPMGARPRLSQGGAI